jgi:GR25 family glycosyltransferase involved in LPS biosynthesis
LKAYVITLEGHAYSEASALRCIQSAKSLEIEGFKAVTPYHVSGLMKLYGIKWTWRDSGNCPITGLAFHRYGGGDARIACALSHYALWHQCADYGEPLLILEHDAVFLRPFEPFEFDKICQVNDPRGATPRGDWWSDQMASRGAGVWPKTHVLEHPRPDGLAGNSAYVIKPEGAKELIDLVNRVGLWPNDALMCRQLVPGLQELYPFLTEVRQEQSTTCG